jgi:uncharacterized protein Veg
MAQKPGEKIERKEKGGRKRKKTKNGLRPNEQTDERTQTTKSKPLPA